MNIGTSIRKFIRNVSSSIAFYPTILAIAFLLLSFVLVAIEYKP
ncbi:MAG: hypothetical protein P8X57_15390 [Cyclobacteriaceae bacterium]